MCILSKKHIFNILECHFPPGFFAEGRRGLAKKLFNSNMGNNMGINMGMNMGIDMGNNFWGIDMGNCFWGNDMGNIFQVFLLVCPRPSAKNPGGK